MTLHPQRCETCLFHTENQYMDFCHGYPMSKDDPTEIMVHIAKYGCATYDDGNDESKLTVAELRERIQYWDGEGLNEDSCGQIEKYAQELIRRGEKL